MSWDAIESLDDARTATRSILLPVSPRTWLRLTVVTFFVGGIGGGGGAGQAAQGAVSAPRPLGPPGTTPTGGFDGVDLSPLADAGVTGSRLATLAVAALAVAVVLVAGYALVGAVMEFVLVECLRTRRVELRRPFRQFLVPGLRLFGFRLGVALALVAAAGLPVLAVGAPSVVPIGVAVVPLVAFTGAVWVVGLVILRLTTDLVVPTMIAEGRTVFSAWRRLLPLVAAAWAEVALYVVVRLALGVAASLAVGLVVGLAALAVAVPFVLAGSAVAFTVGLHGVGTVVVAGLAVAFVLVVVAVGVVVQLPVVTYFRYYGLFVVGRLDHRLDLVRGGPTTTRPPE